MASIYESALTKALDDLESRGYIVQTELSEFSQSPLRDYILGWGVDSNGDLRPMVGVEILSPGLTGGELERLLSEARRLLKLLRDYLGTKTNFVYDGEKWLELSENFLEFNVSSGPVSMSGIETSYVTDIKSITILIEVPFWQSVKSSRNDMPIESAVLIAVEELLKDSRVTDYAVYLSSHPGIGLDPDSLIKACLVLLERGGRNAQFITPRNVIDFNFSKQITKAIMIKGGISDILNQGNIILQDGNQDQNLDRNQDQIIQNYAPGRVASLGLIISPFN